MSLFHPFSLTNKGFQILNDEEGTTLVEELVTVAIIGIGIVILVAMITTGVVGVRQVDDRVLAESLARSQLEIVAVGIEYWNATTSAFVAAVRNDGLQKITVTVSSAGTPLVQTAEYKVDR